MFSFFEFVYFLGENFREAKFTWRKHPSGEIRRIPSYKTRRVTSSACSQENVDRPQTDIITIPLVLLRGKNLLTQPKQVVKSYLKHHCNCHNIPHMVDTRSNVIRVPIFDQFYYISDTTDCRKFKFSGMSAMCKRMIPTKFQQKILCM